MIPGGFVSDDNQQVSVQVARELTRARIAARARKRVLRRRRVLLAAPSVPALVART